MATPIIPGFVGVAATWQALRGEDIVVVRYGRRCLGLPLSKLQAGSLGELPHYQARRTSAGLGQK